MSVMRSLSWMLVVGVVVVVLVVAPAGASHTPAEKLGVASFQTSKAAEHAHQPYRTGYHFQPKKNWMNDPNGPFFYKGWYHFFFQYNRHAAVWGNITWGHAVSTDMVHWRTLHTALKPDHWYDIKGVWSGSAAFLPDGTPVLYYTGWSNEFSSNTNPSYGIAGQVQAMAIPEDPTDPLLRAWTKPPNNPIATPPPGYNSSQFRDPTTPWRAPDGSWRLLVGVVTGADQLTGAAILYTSPDLFHWTFTGKHLHSLHGTGMWECPDFYPVTLSSSQGLETSVTGPDIKHVLKVSLDLKKHDYYSVGTYNATTDSYSPDNPSLDTGIGLRYDYGKFYASKTFFDQSKNRRILWGWANESSSAAADIAKGWSSVQCLPRHIWLDPITTTNLLQWPIEEVDALRINKMTKTGLTLKEGEVVDLTRKGTQLDIEVEFAMPATTEGKAQSPELLAETGQLQCSDLVAGLNHSGYGPFGLHVLATEDLVERTSIFFYVFQQGKSWRTLFCGDNSASSLQADVDKTTYGSYVTVHASDTALAVRVLVDHSIVESFAQGGRTVFTSRVYPARAIGSAARVYLFNNGSESVTVKSVASWDMKSINIKFWSGAP
jgi:beta-fructofuranosidase